MFPGLSGWSLALDMSSPLPAASPLRTASHGPQATLLIPAQAQALVIVHLLLL